jgi:hypothetical protein
MRFYTYVPRWDLKRKKIMAITLADLHKARNVTSIDSITAALNKKTEYDNESDLFWKPEQDKAGNASATIRPLPKAEGDELPFVQWYSHSLKNPKTGKWYIEKCPTTVGRDECPVCTANKALYATKIKSNEELARQRARTLNYATNVLIVNDPKKPELNGTVQPFRAGKIVFGMWLDKIQPTFEEDVPFNIFETSALWDGLNFKLRMHKEGEFPKYSKSGWEDTRSAAAETDEEILNIVNSTQSLAKFVDPKSFKDAAYLQKRWDIFNGVASAPSAEKQAGDLNAALQESVKPTAPKAKAAPAAKAATKPAEEFGDVDTDEMEDFFKDIVE